MFGRSGVNFSQYLSGVPTQDEMGNPLDSPESQAAQLMQQGFFRYTNPGDESQSSRWMSNNPNVDAQGYINIDGQHYVQVGGNQNRLRDPSLIMPNDEYGDLTLASNYNNDDSWADRLAPWAVAALSGMGLAQAGAFGSSLGSMFGGEAAPSLMPNITPTTLSPLADGSPYLFGSGGGAAGGGFADSLVPGFVGAGEGDAAAVAAGLDSNPSWLSRAATAVGRDPMRSLQAMNALTAMFGGAAGDEGGGDAGPTELGSMGWKPPQQTEYKPSAAWLEQYRRSQLPISELRRMYG